MEFDEAKLKLIFFFVLIACACFLWMLVDEVREVQNQLQASAINDELHRRTVIAEEKPAAAIPRRRKKVEEADEPDEES